MANVFCALKSISKEYDIPYIDLLDVCGLNSTPKTKNKIKKQLQAVIFDNKCYYYDEEKNDVYDKENKLVGKICPQSYELISI
jgi:hypothetical protein